VPAPSPSDPVSARRLAAAVTGDLGGANDHGTATAARIVWTGDHLDAARRLQPMIVGPAATAVRRRALGPDRARRP